MRVVLFAVLVVATARGDAPEPVNSRGTLALIGRGSKGQEVRIVSPESLSPLSKPAVAIDIETTNHDGDAHVFVDGELAGTVGTGRATFQTAELSPGLHRAYVILFQDSVSIAEASVQFYVLPSPFDPVNFYTEACQKNEMFSLGINNACDGLFQTGHELRLAGRFEEAEPLLIEAARSHSLPIVYPYIELARLYAQTNDAERSRGARQVIERLQPGYILAQPLPLSSASDPPSTMHIDLRLVEEESLTSYAHLMCLWSGMIITRHAGIRVGGSSAFQPGNHYKLLSLLAKQFTDATFVELGTLHAAATIALASSGNRVISFNVLDDLGSNLKKCGITQEDFASQVPGRMEFHIADATGEEGLQVMRGAQLVFIDTNHHGDIEDMVYQYLSGVGWEGVMVLDDVFLNEEMDSWWGSVTHPKFDLTDYGHTASGTGIIDFSGRLRFSV